MPTFDIDEKLRKASGTAGVRAVWRRRTLFALPIIGLFLIYQYFRGGIVSAPSNTFRTKDGKPFGPPDYTQLREWERNLPQHNLSLPAPEGKTGRYVRFQTHIIGLGWNNVFNEMLLCAEVARQSNRAYVFQEYAWMNRYYPWHVSNSAPHPMTPLPALIAGPTVGGNWEPNDPSPRSVNVEYYEKACPPSERVEIKSSFLKAEIKDETGDVVFKHMVKHIKEHPARCLDIIPDMSEDGWPQLFDLWLIGDPRGLPGWELFVKTPTSRLLGTSPLVASAVDRNEYLFLPKGPRPPQGAPIDPYSRMMAVHIRRGDFENACKDRALWSSTYYQWNLWRTHPDQFKIPPNCGNGSADDAAKEIYRKHCYPTDSEILTKIREAKRDYLANGAAGSRWLDVIFLMTNADATWVDMFKREVAKDGWFTVVTTKDLTLDAMQTDVGMAVDMEIARKAAVVIGNGWSSFTSNIMHRRIVDEREPMANRFW